MSIRTRHPVLLPALLAARLLCLPAAAPAQNSAPVPPTPAPLTLDQVVGNLVARNLQRTQALQSYQSRRTYTVFYHGFPADLHARMVADLTYIAPDTKRFTIVSESGPKLLIDQVLRRLLQVETGAQQNHSRQNLDLNPANYNFSNLEYHPAPDGCSYSLSVQPRTSSKYLYRGQIWIHDKDFAVCRIQAEPARNPSFWITRSTITELYAKFGQFWLPVQNISQSKMRGGGTATLTILYRDYQIPAPAIAVPSPGGGSK